uniref:Uncharacterized protein n=1 Tax=Cannabis sativa TaxID=3483 RepID=A0A803Q8F5_CANSA
MTHQGCEEIIRNCWDRMHGHGIEEKIEECGRELLQWGKDAFGSFASRIKSCNRELKRYKSRRDEEGKQLFYDAKKELFAVLNQRETFWKQRSKQLWLKEGDQNSKFFHSKASTRRRNNQIFCLKDDEGNLCHWDSGLDNVIVDFYSNLFTAESTTWEDVLDCAIQQFVRSIM